VPFYDWFCRVTGFGGVTNIATSGSDTILDQTSQCGFDSAVASDMPWTFKPVQREMGSVLVNSSGLLWGHNPTDHAIAGSTSYNVHEARHF
jgi:cytochrome c oxidase assembly protein subunit 11